jgi:hypothetical protein
MEHTFPSMLRMPGGALTGDAKRNLERFFATSAAREIEDDPHSWTVVEWTWGAGPPIRVHLRAENHEVIDFVMDATGVWQLWREPIDRKIALHDHLAR